MCITPKRNGLHVNISSLFGLNSAGFGDLLIYQRQMQEEKALETVPHCLMKKLLQGNLKRCCESKCSAAASCFSDNIYVESARLGAHGC